MKKSVEIYCLIICFFTMACLTVVSGMFLYQIARITMPTVTIDPYKIRAFAEVTTKLPMSSPHMSSRATPVAPETAAEQQAVRAVKFKAALTAEQAEGQQKAVKFFIIILINLLIFIPHWRMARKN